jgi:hypothetical protein
MDFALCLPQCIRYSPVRGTPGPLDLVVRSHGTDVVPSQAPSVIRKEFQLESPETGIGSCTAVSLRRLPCTMCRTEG